MMSRTKSRKELEEEGVYLNGPIVPEWFKPKCDGCSVPKGIRWAMKANQGHAPCVIHDWKYFVIPLAYSPNNIMREHERIKADYELKINRGMVAKNRVFGKLFGMFYFRGVRIGGKRAITKSKLGIIDKSPNTIDEINELNKHIEKYYPDYDDLWFKFLIREMRIKVDG